MHEGHLGILSPKGVPWSLALGIAVALLFSSTNGWTQKPYTKEEASSDLATYTILHGITFATLESCINTFPNRRQQFQEALKKVRSTDVAFFKKLEARKSFLEGQKYWRALLGKPPESMCDSSLSSSEQHAEMGLRLAEKIRDAQSPAEFELQTLSEIHASQISQIELCIARFPDKQKQTIRSYARFKKDNLETIKILESHRGYKNWLRESNEFLDGALGRPSLDSSCAVLEQTIDGRLADHVLKLGNVRSLYKQAKNTKPLDF